MELPYKKVETFQLGTDVYTTEASALQAAIEKVVGNPGMASQVMREACALAPLLARACELGLGNKPATGAESEPPAPA
jgi:hypothetical protein